MERNISPFVKLKIYAINGNSELIMKGMDKLIIAFNKAEITNYSQFVEKLNEIYNDYGIIDKISDIEGFRIMEFNNLSINNIWDYLSNNDVIKVSLISKKDNCSKINDDIKTKNINKNHNYIESLKNKENKKENLSSSSSSSSSSSNSIKKKINKKKLKELNVNSRSSSLSSSKKSKKDYNSKINKNNNKKDIKEKNVLSSSYFSLDSENSDKENKLTEKKSNNNNNKINKNNNNIKEKPKNDSLLNKKRKIERDFKDENNLYNNKKKYISKKNKNNKKENNKNKRINKNNKILTNKNLNYELIPSDKLDDISFLQNSFPKLFIKGTNIKFKIQELLKNGIGVGNYHYGVIDNFNLENKSFLIKISENDSIGEKTMLYMYLYDEDFMCVEIKNFVEIWIEKDKNNVINNDEKIEANYNMEIDEELTKQFIKRQIEYYFSDNNYKKDSFLKSKEDKDGYIPISILMSFNKIKMITTDQNIFIKALKEDENSNNIEKENNKLYELSDDLSKIRKIK